MSDEQQSKTQSQHILDKIQTLSINLQLQRQLIFINDILVFKAISQKLKFDAAFFFLSNSHKIFACASNVPSVFMLVQALPYLYQLQYFNDSRYNKYRMFNNLHCCKTFPNALMLCKYSLQVYPKIQGVKIVGDKIKSITDDWKAIGKNIVDLVTRKTDEKQLCGYCRKLLESDKYDWFKSLEKTLNNAQQLVNLGPFAMTAINRQLKQTFVQFFLTVSRNCDGWQEFKAEYQRVMGNKHIQQVERSLALLAQTQEKFEVSSVQVKQQVLLQQPLRSSLEEESYSRRAPTESYQQIFSRPQKKSTQKKIKE